MKKLFLSILISIPAVFFCEEIVGQNLLNVKKFGAKADGITDDTKAIQKAIQAANVLEKTVIYFPPGTYIIKSHTATNNYLENYCLKMHSNLHFKGEINKSIIKLGNAVFSKRDSMANAHIFYGAKVENISFSNLAFDLNGAKNLVPKNVIKNNAAIFVKAGSNIEIDNIAIKNASGTNMINIMGSGKGLSIKNSTFKNGGYYVGSSKLINKYQHDFSFIYSEWDDTHISECIIKQENINIALSFYSGGIELHGSNSSVKNSSITGCYPAIYISSTMAPMQDVLIQNNKLLYCTEGISFWLWYKLSNVTIENNYIRLTHFRFKNQSPSVGIKVPNGNSAEYNKRLANAADITNLRIIKNTIIAAPMLQQSAGMMLHSIKNSLIEGNKLVGMNYAGIGILGSKWGTDSLLIQNNSFVDFNINNSKKIVAGYAVISDTYSPLHSSAPGLKNILFEKNKFVRGSSSQKLKNSGDFFGAFIALPKKMQSQIKFKDNNFLNSSEKIHIVNTD